MEMAQWGVPITWITAQDVQNALSNLVLMKAIGAGIGNTAARTSSVISFFGATGYGMEDSSINTYNGALGCNPAAAGSGGRRANSRCIPACGIQREVFTWLERGLLPVHRKTTALCDRVAICEPDGL
jgi:hypothetical protein